MILVQRSGARVTSSDTETASSGEHIFLDEEVGRTRSFIVAAIALAAAGGILATAQTGTVFEFHVERLLATPTPAGPVLLASDAAAWNLTLVDPTIVWIEARTSAASPFFLTTNCGGFGVATPTSHDVRICSRPGTWQVQVDPAAGAAVDIIVRFRGHVSDVGGAASAFTVEETTNPDSTRCVVTGVCLP